MYYEAAAVDGAGVLRKFRSITLPLLTPIIFFNLVLQIIDAFQTLHAGVRRLGRHRWSGRLDDVLHALPLPEGLQAFDMGYASAMAWVLLVFIVGVMTAINFFASKFWVFYDD